MGSQGLRAELDDRAYDWGLVRLGRVQHSRNTKNTTLLQEQRGTTAEAGYRLCRLERTSMRGTEEDARVRGDTASVSECGHEAPLSQKHSADGGHSGPDGR